MSTFIQYLMFIYKNDIQLSKIYYFVDNLLKLTRVLDGIFLRYILKLLP